MNYVAASLLYHSEEWMAFWIMVAIFEKFEMRDIYLPSTKYLSSKLSRVYPNIAKS